MTRFPDSKTWHQMAAEHLEKMAFNLRQVRSPQLSSYGCITFAKLKSQKRLDDFLDDLLPKRQPGLDRCIYAIKLQSGTDMKAFMRAFRDEKEAKKFALPKVNQSDQEHSSILYIGSSFGSDRSGRKRPFRQRLRNHLSEKCAKTYGLHLSGWAGELSGGISIQAWQYPQDTERLHLLAMEDVLHVRAKPLFGQRGIKN